MNIEQYKNVIRICRKADIPLMAWGPPGIGKTRGFEQFAIEENISSIILQGPLLQPIDLLGLPDRIDDRTKWLRPEILPTDGEGILGIDELPDSSMSMQKAYYQLILDGKVQSHVLPKTWWRMGMGNRPEDKSMSSNMPAPLITRFCHIGVCCPCPDFTEHTIESAEIDENQFISHCISNFNPLVTAFLKFQPNFCYKYQAVPRTWEYISYLLNSEKDYFSFEIKELIKGTIGSNVGTQFNSFLSIATKIPSIDAIIINPTSVDVPIEVPIVYAVITALIHKTNKENVSNIITFIERLDNESQFFYFISIRDKFPEVIANTKYIEWMNKNKEYLM